MQPYKDLQEVFDKAYIGLAAQGFVQSKNIFPSMHDGVLKEFCAYRSKDGKKCAIGQLIPDSFVTLASAGKSIGTLLYYDLFPEWKELFQNVNRNDLSVLQAAHDYGKTPNDMKDRLHNFAFHYVLTIPHNK